MWIFRARADDNGAMPTRASGTFLVELTPQAEDASIGRNLIAKQFHGDFEGTSKAQMLFFMGGVKGSGGYVEMERVTGKLNGKAGSFALQHSGTMTRGAQSLSVTIVPDSGSEELTGISGSMDIEIAEGKHSYNLTYEIITA
jgi:hypothetical protein